MFKFDKPKFIVARTWKAYLSLFNFDLLKIWKSEDNGRWCDGYLGHGYPHADGTWDLNKFMNQATVFDDRNYAESVAVIMESRWPGTRFNVIEIPPCH